MAARKTLPHSQRTRDKIRTSMLINRLEKFVEGGDEAPKLSSAQVTAALGDYNITAYRIVDQANG